jgi:transposase
VLSEAAGIPLAVFTTPANVRDEQPLIGMLDALPAVKRPNGHRRYKPGEVMADRGYGFPWTIADVLRRRIASLIAPRGSGHGSGLGKRRYVIERTMAWLARFRRIDHCRERTGEHWQAFNELACCMICAERLDKNHIVIAT